MKKNIFNPSLTAKLAGAFTRWNRPQEVDAAKAKELSLNLSVPETVSSLLLRRTGGDIGSAQDLWTGNHLYLNAMLLPGMKEAIHRLVQAVESRDHVLVYSDFDADGVSSAVILKESLEFAGISKVSVFFPCRFQDGYGFHRERVSDFKEQGVNLIITADCGITGWDACQEAKSWGIDVIITDHHKVDARLPEARAILNPQLSSWKPFQLQDLSGAGVAYLLAKTFIEAACGEKKPPRDWGLDMLVLSIAGDGQPVTGLNRLWIKKGLELLRHTRRPGIFALLCVSGIFKPRGGLADPVLGAEVERRDLEYERDVMFGLVPRINAAGRMKSARDAFDLLCERDRGKAFEGADYLDKLNLERRSIEGEILKECYERIPSPSFAGHSRYSLCLFGADWHEGVVGICASRVKDRYWRPCAILAGSGKVVKGSVRGVPGLNIHEALSGCRELFLNFGGHEAAGGFSLVRENLPLLEDRFEAIIESLLEASPIERVLQLDQVFPAQGYGQEDLMAYTALEPFGQGNPRPVIGLFDGKIAGARLLGKAQNHLELTLKKGPNSLRLLWFGAGDKAAGFCLAGRCDAAFTPNKNTFRGREQVSLFVSDLRLSWSVLGRNYEKLKGQVKGFGPSILYTWSSHAAESMHLSLLNQGVRASLHLKGWKGALIHNARLALKEGGTVVSTAPWELLGQGPKQEIRLLVIHPPISQGAQKKLATFAESENLGCIFMDEYLRDSNTWLIARCPPKEYVERVWKCFVEKSGRVEGGQIPLWEAGPMHSQGFPKDEGASYEQKLLLLESCISIFEELGMISYDVCNRVPCLSLKVPKGQVSLSGSALYKKGLRVRKAVGA